MLTLQEIFDKASQHMLTQMAQSMDHTNFSLCMYRGPDGLKCAAGALIPDDAYHPKIEGMVVADTQSEQAETEPESADALLRKALLAGGVNVNDRAVLNLVSALQDIHDEGCVFRWRDRLTALAEKNGLKGPAA